jgi:hypothetical protein
MHARPTQARYQEPARECIKPTPVYPRGVFVGSPTRSIAIVSFAAALACNVDDPGLADGETEAADATETGDQPSEFASLIDQAAWTELGASEDPLAEHRPSLVECTIAGWYPEGQALEIDTNYCNYLALGQPTLVPITEGLGVRLGFYHFDLTAPVPAIAHVAVLVDGALLWEQDVEIPGAAFVYEIEFEAPWSAPAGAELVFHLHNHGQNTWVLQNLTAEQ